MTKVNINLRKSLLSEEFIKQARLYGSVEKCWGNKNKKHKKHPFTDASASHLSSARWHV